MSWRFLNSLEHMQAIFGSKGVKFVQFTFHVSVPLSSSFSFFLLIQIAFEQIITVSSSFLGGQLSENAGEVDTQSPYL